MESINHNQPDAFAVQREQMVRDQLEARGIRDPRILHAFREVPRHEFVLPEFQDQAYEDHPLPIGKGQTISQPYIVAAMLQHLRLQPADRVLEVGTGSGYATALLSRLCSEVHSIERHAGLAHSAQVVLARLGYSNVHLLVGDGSQGWPEPGPYDAILVSAAADEMSRTLMGQLCDGGRMIIPVGSTFNQELQLVTNLDGRPEVRILEGCRFVPLVEGKP